FSTSLLHPSACAPRFAAASTCALQPAERSLSCSLRHLTRRPPPAPTSLQNFVRSSAHGPLGAGPPSAAHSLAAPTASASTAATTIDVVFTRTLLFCDFDT